MLNLSATNPILDSNMPHLLPNNRTTARRVRVFIDVIVGVDITIGQEWP
ncbi:MAG: hypothetical protein N2C12_19025 [Planctomycetales bacterium]